MKIEKKKIYTKVRGLRFRKTPNTSSMRNVVRELKVGRELELIDGPWLKVRDGRTEGWVHGDYVTEEVPSVRKISKASKAISYNIVNKAPEFVKGQANPGSSSNTKKVREIIGYEFRYETPFEKTNLQCTEYVQFKVLQKLGHKINWGKHKSGRHGGKWWIILKKLGYVVLENPKENCVVSFTEVRMKDGTLTKEGHVAFIESVDSNGTIHILEANWPSHGKFSKRSILKQRWQNYYKAKFIEIL